MSEAVVSVRSLSHRFGAQQVLRDISFEVDARRIMAVMGSSGGGKTTLLRCVAGLIRPTAGEVRIAGVDAVREPERARAKLGFVFQSSALFDYLNVRDNVLFGLLRRRPMSRQEQDDTADRLLSQVGLAGEGGRMPSELSGGMRKRVGLARALASEPEVVLYDEPTAGLDPVTAYAIDEMIVETAHRLGVTSILVSHDVTSVFRVAQRIAFLDGGALQFLGTPDEFERSTEVSIRELIRKAESRSLY